jgi:hypothetical protein
MADATVKELLEESTAAQEKGKAARKAQIQEHMDKIEARKASLIKAGHQLMSEGKQDTPEYDALIESHRFLRGKQRFLEDAKEMVDTDPTMSSRQSNEAAAKKPEKTKFEKGSDALDRLRRGINEDESQ